MNRAFEKIVSLFAVLVVVTMLVNHGMINFSAIDKAKEVAKTAAQSEEGQALINETKETSRSVFWQLLDGFKRFIGTDDNSSDENNTAVDGLITATLVSIKDGDTVVVNTGDGEITVRLIGIDTPESVNPDESKNNIYGEYASEYTKTLLANTDALFLEYDTSTKDSYGRDLAYVWFSNDTSDINNMLNAILVRDGYAYDKVYMPNNKYAEEFMNLRLEAQKNKSGLWKYEEFAALWE